MGLCPLPQAVRNADSGFSTCCMGIRIGKIHRHERAEHFQITRLEFFLQGSCLGGHKSPIPQFGAIVASGLHFIEHLELPRGFSFQVEFKNSPRTGGVSDFDHGIFLVNSDINRCTNCRQTRAGSGEDFLCSGVYHVHVFSRTMLTPLSIDIVFYDFHFLSPVFSRW